MLDSLIVNEYTIHSNKESEKIKQELVKQLSDIIIHNREILRVISKIVTLFENQHAILETREEFNGAIDRNLKRSKIPNEIKEQFKVLWVSLDDNGIGQVLEEVVEKLGAYSIDEQVQVIRNCMVYSVSKKEEIKNDTYTRKNLDIVFFTESMQKEFPELNLSAKKIDGTIEFHECKKNIQNEVPKKPFHKCQMESKLIFMKKIYEFIINNKLDVSKKSFYIPTFAYKPETSQKYLDDNGYGFIKIIDIDVLCKKYASTY